MENRLTEIFQRFAANEAAGYERLYEVICLGIADDAEIHDILTVTLPGQPYPNMIFAAVQSLLLQGAEGEIRNYYASVVDDVLPPDEAFPHFRTFLLENRERVQEILSTRRVQTNEVGRCAYLYPLFSEIAQRAGRPLALVEIGTSAGLNLNWDLYRYRYGENLSVGPHDSPVVVESEFRGDPPSYLPDLPPAIASKIGVDLNPLDVTRDDDAFWLRSLVWPGHKHRVERLAAAIEVARRHPPVVVEGNGVDMVPELIAALPADVLPVLFHTHALYQFPEHRTQLTEILAAESHGREICDLGVERRNRPFVNADVQFWNDGSAAYSDVLDCQPHGKWIAWRGL